MDCLVSNGHLYGTAVLKLAPEDEDEDTTIERKSHRNTGHECSVNIVEAAAGGEGGNPSKNPSKNPSRKSVQKIRPKTLSKHPCHFVIAIVPIGFVSGRPVLKTSTSNLNAFMGLMATLHEGCLQVYICSRDGQIQTKK